MPKPPPTSGVTTRNFSCGSLKTAWPKAQPEEFVVQVSMDQLVHNGRALAQLLPPRTRKSGPKPGTRQAAAVSSGPGTLQGAW